MPKLLIAHGGAPTAVLNASLCGAVEAARARMDAGTPHWMARLATSGLSVVWVPLKATRTSRWPGRLSARGAPAG